MSSPSAYDSSPPSSSFSPFTPFSGSELEQTPPQPHTSRLHAPAPRRPPQPPRLPSPRLFRDFFNAMSDSTSRRQATLPRANFRDTMQDVNRAIQSASRALQTAQEAFQSRPSRSTSEVVDLTGSPPEHTSESLFMSRTTHPHDSSHQSSRRMNTLNEPVYGSRTRFTPDPISDPSDSLSRARYRRLQDLNHAALFPLPLPTRDAEVRLQEEQAIRRQRENHTTWERTQARARQHQQNLQPTMSPPLSSLPSQRSSSQSIPSRSSSPLSATSSIEAVDLTAVNNDASLAAALSKQREEAIISQKSHASASDSGRTTLTAYKCPICMDIPTDATSTTCGHVFCHRCIIDTLKWSKEQRRDDAPAHRKVKGVCPVCRTELDLKDQPGNGRTLVPLELKLITRKRKRDDKGKQKEKVPSSSDHDRQEVEGSEKENGKNGKSRKLERENTDDMLWGEFMTD